MKILKLIAGIVSAILLLEIVMRLASPIIGPPQTVWQIQQQAKLIKIQERPNELGPIDMVIMGDSTGKEGVDPDILDAVVGGGFHSFNASLNSSTTYTIMKQFEELVHFATPRYLLLLIGPNTSRQSDNDKSVRIYKQGDSASQETGLKGILNRDFYLYRYRNTLRDPFILNTIYRSIRFHSLREGVVYRNVDTMKFNGDSSFERTPNSYAQGKWFLPKVESRVTSVNLPLATMRHLRILKAACRKIGAKLILSTVPTSSYEPNYRALVPAIASKLGLDFVQGNDATTDRSNFIDGVHLNAPGALVFSKFVGEKLRGAI
ncbi:MAG: hypothetical protein WA090_03490 [Candidatus Nanopelagicaceae bacterium]